MAEATGDKNQATKTATTSRPYIFVFNLPDEQKRLRIENLRLETPQGRVLVDDCNMTLHPGDKVMLMGPLGSGKTTLTKAINNNWDYGNGRIFLPENTNILFVPQSADFPNVSVKKILIGPNPRREFSDDELAQVLRDVGHERLIQHIPGAQVKIVMDRLLSDVPDLLKPYREKKAALSPLDLRNIGNALMSRVQPMVAESFDIVQYVLPEQEQYLRENLGRVLNETLATPLSAEQTDALADKVVQQMDISLVQPLVDKFEAGIKDYSETLASEIIPYSPGRLSYFAYVMRHKLENNLAKYRANKDTYLPREVKINERQCDHLARTIEQGIEANYKKLYHPEDSLKKLFKTVAWPVTAPASALIRSSESLTQAYNAAANSRIAHVFRQAAHSVSGVAHVSSKLFAGVGNLLGRTIGFRGLSKKAGRVAGEIYQTVSAYLEREVLTGDKFSLSGGERQKLVMAQAMLHKPDIAILDEVTSAMDIDAGKKFYSELIRRLPDAIIISISHNPYIMPFHNKLALLNKETKQITVQPVTPELLARELSLDRTPQSGPAPSP